MTENEYAEFTQVVFADPCVIFPEIETVLKVSQPPLILTAAFATVLLLAGDETVGAEGGVVSGGFVSPGVVIGGSPELLSA